jgi:ribosome-associated protein
VARDDLEIRRNLTIPARELVESAGRAGGPGGQHVNKTNTRVTIHWNVRESVALTPEQRRRLLARLETRITRGGDLVIHAGGTRSRAKNREEARTRLAEIVDDALRTVRRRVPTRPGRAAVGRRLAAKKHQSRSKERRLRPRPDDA